jgi:NADH:ubiquinone oxidoreductase subunit C
MIFTNKKSKLLFFCIQKTFATFLKHNLCYLIKKTKVTNLEIEAWVLPWNIYPILTFCKSNTLSQLDMLIDIVVSDNPKDKYRFILRYLLLSTTFNYRLTLITKSKELMFLLSVNSIFNSSNWLEREIWDLFGIFFLLHPNLRRILTEYGFQSHPLRKDFPFTGFSEVIYDDSQKRIVKKQLELSQEYRNFDFHSSWSIS